MLNICDKIEETKSKFQDQCKDFIDIQRRNKIYEKVPADMEIHAKNATSYLQTKLTLINNAKKLKIWSKHFDIRAGFDCVPSDYSKKYVDSFKNWERNPVEEEHVKTVESSIRFMKREYDELSKKFIDDVEAVDRLTPKLNETMTEVNNLFDELITSTDIVRASKIIWDLVPKLYSIILQQSQLISDLATVKQILNLYNEKRSKWAEFLIGMRSTLNSRPLPVKLLKGKYVKKIVSNVGGNQFLKKKKDKQ